MLTEDDDAAGESSTVALAAVTGDIKQRLVEFQKQFLAPLMRNFDLRIKIPASAQKLKVVIDFSENAMGSNGRGANDWASPRAW